MYVRTYRRFIIFSKEVNSYQNLLSYTNLITFRFLNF